MNQSVHTPRHIYAKEGPRVIGFVRTEIDVDETASRKIQTERIRAYTEQHGMTEPLVLPTASRKDLDRTSTKGCIIVTTRLANLLRRPSDVDELLSFTAGKSIRLHVLDLGGECSEKLGIIRQVADCFAPLERLIEGMKKSAQETAAHNDEIMDDVVVRAVRLVTEKLLGLKSEVSKIKHRAIMDAQDPSLKERRATAEQMIANILAPSPPSPSPSPSPFALHS